jgi:type I restriction enzyme S subunit
MKMDRPKVRFKGFTDDWEKRKFSDIAVRESTAQTSAPDIPSVEYEDVVAEEGRLNKEIRLKEIQKSGITFDGSQILYGKLRPYLHNWLNPDFKGVAVGDWWVLKPVDADKDFLYRLIQTQQFDNIANQSAGSKMPRADWNLISNSVFMVPSSQEEQNKIGTYFSNLDHLITFHQRKCEQTKKLKKYMLQKMFPKDGQSVPEIRMAGFTDAWEQRKLSDYLSVSSQKNKDEKYEKEDVLSVSGDYGIVNQIEFQGRSFAGASVANYGVVETNDVVYTKSPLKANPYGIIKTNKGKPGIVSTLYAVYHPTDITDSEFIQVYFEQDTRMNSYMHPLVNKGAKNDMKVSAENALKGDVVFPKLDEQRQISDYFRRLDHLITLHQRKCDELKNIKKFMLQNMFI